MPSFNQQLRGLLTALALLLPAATLRAQAPAWTGAVELIPTGDNAAALGQRLATGPGGALYNAGQLRGTATFGSLPPLAQQGTNYLARLDPATGQWAWALPIGGWGGDLDIVSLEADPVSGNVLVAGAGAYIGSSTVHTFGTFTTYGGSFVACASPTGQWLWAISPAYNFRIRAATWDGASGVAVAGSFGGSLTLGTLTATATPGSTSSLGTADGLVAHLSSTQQWDALLPLGAVEDEQLTTLAYDAVGGTVAVGGYTTSPALTIGATPVPLSGRQGQSFVARGRLVGGGAPAWLGAVVMGDANGEARPEALRFDAAGQLLVMGRAFANPTLGTTPVVGSFLGRLNAVSQQWSWVATTANGSGYAPFTSFVSAPGGSVWVGGNFSGTATFGSSSITSPTTGYLGELGFVARLDGATGAWLEAIALTGAARLVPGLALDPTGTTLFTTGQPVAQASVAVFGNTPLMGGFGTAYVGALNVTTAGAPVWRWAAAPAVGSGATLARFVRDGAGNLTVIGTYYRRLTLGGTTLTTPNAAEFVAQCTPGGQWRWARELPSFRTADQVPLLAVDGADNLYVGGVVRPPITAIGPFPVNVPTNRAALCVASLDAAGNWRWVSAALASLRGSGNLFAADLAAGASGHPTLTGFFQDTLTIGATRLVGTRRGTQRVFDGYVARLDAATGQWQWAAQVRGRREKFPKSVAVDGLGGAVLAGFGADTVRFGAIALDPAFANQTQLLPYVARLSPAGQWLTAAGVTPLLSGAGQIGSTVLVATNDAGDVLLTGNMSSNTVRFGPHPLSSALNSGYTIPFVARLSGQPLQWQWVHALADTLRGGISQLISYRYNTVLPALDAAGNAYLGGTASGRLPFAGLPTLPPGSYPGVLKLNAAGQAQWLATGFTALTDYAYASVDALFVTPAGQPLIGGLYSGPVQFGATTLARYSYYNGYIAALGVPLAVADDAGPAAPATLWPNPARTAATLQLPAPAPSATAVQLLDGLGRVVRAVPVAAGATTVVLPLGGLAPGLYVVRGAGSAQRLMVGDE